MRRFMPWFSLCAVVMFPLAYIRAQEVKIPLDKVPKAALDTVKAKFPGAKMVEAAREVEDGKTFYEVSIQHKGQNIDILLTPEGKIVEVEKEIPAKDLPAAVSKAVDGKYPKATIKKAEEKTEGDKVSYEVLLVTAEKKTVEVLLDPNGKILNVENKTGKGDD